MRTLGFPPELHTVNKPGTKFVGYGGITVTTAECSYGLGSVLAGGPMKVVSVTATQDGLRYVGGWHEGESTESVYVEKYGAEGRVFHGWIDKVSRKLTQTG